MIEIEYTEEVKLQFANRAAAESFYSTGRDWKSNEALTAVRVWLKRNPVTIGELNPRYEIAPSRVGYSAETRINGRYYSTVGATPDEALAELMAVAV